MEKYYFVGYVCGDHDCFKVDKIFSNKGSATSYLRRCKTKFGLLSWLMFDESIANVNADFWDILNKMRTVFDEFTVQGFKDVIQKVNPNQKEQF